METLPLPLPCKLLIDKKPSLTFISASSDVKNVDKQVIKLGTNPVKRTFKLTWKALALVSEKDTVETFLRLVGTWRSFLITETSYGITPIKVCCISDYSVSNNNESFELSVDVQEVFR